MDRIHSERGVFVAEPKTLGERIITSLGGVTEEQWQARLADEESRTQSRVYNAYAQGFQEARAAPPIEDETPPGTLAKYGYKSIVGDSIRAFGGLDYDKIVNIAWTTYLSNPLAKRMIEIKRDYIWGRGVGVHVQPGAEGAAGQKNAEDLQAILDDFWMRNRFDQRMPKFILELLLFGVQVYPAFVKQTNGAVSLSYFDPSQIDSIVSNPHNFLEKWAVVIKAQEDAAAWTRPSQSKRVYRIVRQDAPMPRADGKNMAQAKYDGLLVTAEQATLAPWEQDMLKAHGRAEYDGTCFYFHVNDVSGQERGYSDLLQVIDWLDQLDAVLFALADREHLASFFAWMVKMDDASPDQVQARADELRLRQPKKGSVNVHSHETWSADSPDLKQIGSVETAEMLIDHILGAMGIPRHWFSRGSETNLATAQAQGEPTFRTLQNDQAQVEDALLYILEFAKDQAIIAGEWTEQGETIVLTMPEMTKADLVHVSQAATQLADALIKVDGLGIMPKEAQAELWQKLVAEVGIEYELTEMDAGLRPLLNDEQEAMLETLRVLEQREPFIPVGASEPVVPVPSEVTITDADVNAAMALFDRLMPTLRGMLDTEGVMDEEVYDGIQY
jgi:hypothetical protein